MTKNKTLGQGLGALLTPSKSSLEDFSQSSILIGKIKPNHNQPRKSFEDKSLKQLAQSIEEKGLISPITVKQFDNKYIIVAGERRYRAHKLLKKKRILAYVIDAESNKDIMYMALIENIQREDLNVIEEAQALERLQNEFDLTHQQVAEVIGKSRTTVTNLLRLNQLENSIKRLVEQKKLEMGHARSLLALEHPQQIEVAAIIIKKQLSVRDTEKLVKKWLEPAKDKPEVSIDAEAKMLSERLSERLETPVSITRQPNGKGKLVISFDEYHKMEQLLAILER